jgi:integrase
VKATFRLKRRQGIYYAFNTATGKRESLGTRNKNEATALLAAKAQSYQQPVLNKRMARVYMSASDPQAVKRTWRDVLNCMAASKKGENKERWERMDRHPPLTLLWNKVVMETTAEELWSCLNSGTVTTNKFLRIMRNFAVDMEWLLHPLIPNKQWPAVKYAPKRAITPEEHETIIAREENPERRLYYQLAWHTGASQTDLANLTAERVNWDDKYLSFSRKKTKTQVQLFFGEKTAAVLRALPSSGPLFPYLKTLRSADRATEFKQRCDGLAIEGVTLHSYRYGWAQRGQESGYPERFAMLALGHSSKAVHRAYAQRAEVKLPSLEEYEQAAVRKKIVSFPSPALPLRHRP